MNRPYEALCFLVVVIHESSVDSRTNPKMSSLKGIFTGGHIGPRPTMMTHSLFNRLYEFKMDILLGLINKLSQIPNKTPKG